MKKQRILFLVITSLMLGLSAIIKVWGSDTTIIYAPPQFQNDLIADLTTQFTLKYSTSPGYWFVTISTETGSSCSGGGIAPCQLDQDINTMVANSTYNYVYGWSDASVHQQYTDMALSGVIYTACVNQSTSTFLVIGTTGTYDLNISSIPCIEAVNAVDQEIYQQMLSGPVTGYFYP